MADGRIIIVGGGLAGLGIGRELVQAGRETVVLERDRAGRGASWRAAGMLAPDAEIEFEEQELYQLNRESRRRWPTFAEEIETETGQSIDYRTEGTLLVADDRDSAEALRRRYAFQQEQGLDVDWLTGDEALEIEPFLAPRLSAAVWSPSDHQVDNRRLVEALRASFEHHGGTLREHAAVLAVEPDDETPAVVTEDGERFEGSTVVIAAGAWSRQIDGLPAAVQPPVRPVKGQMIELRIERPFGLEHVVRGPDAYLVPKSDGRLLVGATSEERGFDTEVTAGGIYDLLEGAWEVVPGIYDLPLTDTWVGLRPGSRDHKPLLGRTDAPGIVLATGQYRHGVLLTPVIAQEIARLLLKGEPSEWIAPFSPRRFSEVTT